MVCPRWTTWVTSANSRAMASPSMGRGPYPNSSSPAIVSRRRVRPAFFDGLLCRVPCFVLSFQGLFPVTTTIAMAEGKNLVGVDIGASSIKVVQLKEARKKLQIVRWGMAPLPPQTIIDGHVMNAGAVTEGLARIFHDS